MTDQPILSDAEWALIADLLAMEQSELPVEIRHAQIGAAREELHRRKEIVDDLLKRLQQPAAV
jgi:hypothetical protein